MRKLAEALGEWDERLASPQLARAVVWALAHDPEAEQLLRRLVEAKRAEIARDMED